MAGAGVKTSSRSPAAHTTHHRPAAGDRERCGQGTRCQLNSSHARFDTCHTGKQAGVAHSHPSVLGVLMSRHPRGFFPGFTHHQQRSHCKHMVFCGERNLFGEEYLPMSSLVPGSFNFTSKWQGRSCCMATGACDRPSQPGDIKPPGSCEAHAAQTKRRGGWHTHSAPSRDDAASKHVLQRGSPTGQAALRRPLTCAA